MARIKIVQRSGAGNVQFFNGVFFPEPFLKIIHQVIRLLELFAVWFSITLKLQVVHHRNIDDGRCLTGGMVEVLQSFAVIDLEHYAAFRIGCRMMVLFFSGATLRASLM